MYVNIDPTKKRGKGKHKYLQIPNGMQTFLALNVNVINNITMATVEKSAFCSQTDRVVKKRM